VREGGGRRGPRHTLLRARALASRGRLPLLVCCSVLQSVVSVNMFAGVLQVCCRCVAGVLQVCCRCVAVPTLLRARALASRGRLPLLVCCSALQCVAECFKCQCVCRCVASVLQVCCSAYVVVREGSCFPWPSALAGVLQCVAVCCSVLQKCCMCVLQSVVGVNVSQCVAERCSALQCVAGVLQVCCSAYVVAREGSCFQWPYLYIYVYHICIYIYMYMHMHMHIYICICM